MKQDIKLSAYKTRLLYRHKVLGFVF